MDMFPDLYGPCFFLGAIDRVSRTLVGKPELVLYQCCGMVANKKKQARYSL